MFKANTINHYKDISKEYLLLWIRESIKKMHKDLNLEDSEFKHIDTLMNASTQNIVTIAEIRREAFKLHQKARSSIDLTHKLLYRIYGQSLSIIHVKTHAFHAANYILKLYKLYDKDVKLVYENQVENLESAYQVTYKKLDDII
ncbi:putative immunity protein [Mariniplasma anaerobium]|uniref:Imm-5-like domain-containing protein n=1 Tax=Mariniplasma anaerobium TaxID=2735436 RepID=A0A7U9XW70_9MOLU|nr:hypothetical protein [Mariniplasma anaerobium]BCR36314.1 hypothetical protein MPAN_012070 [Mariniplasma anaerobium]